MDLAHKKARNLTKNQSLLVGADLRKINHQGICQ